MAREMKDSGIEWIGEIPQQWNTIKFKYLIDSTNAGEVIDKNYWNSGNELLYTCQKTPMLSDYVGFPEKKRTQAGDILLTRNATPYVFIPETGAIYSNVVQRVKIKQGYNIKYIQYTLLQGAESLIVNGNTIPSYNMEIWKNIFLPLVPLDQQVRIVKFLDYEFTRVDAIIDQTRASIEEYKKLKQAIITQAVTKGIRPDRQMKDSGKEWIGRIPAEWDLVKTKAISSRIVVGVVVKPADYFDDNGSIPFLRGINVKEYSIIPEPMVYISEESNAVLSKSIIHIDDLLIVRDGSIGTACVVPAEYEGANVVSMIIVSCKKDISPQFLCYSFNSDVGKTQFNLTKIGSALTHTSVQSVANIVHAIPAYDEQIEIVEYLQKQCFEVDRLIKNKEQIVAELESYKKSLIYEYVTGKKEVPTCQ